MVPNNINPLELLNMVNSFYTSAWNNLVIIGTLLIAILGFAWPFFLDILQKRSYKIREEQLKKDLETHIATIIETKFKEQNIQIKEWSDSLEKAIEKTAACSEASAFQVQGYYQIGQDLYGEAFESYVLSAEEYVTGCDEYNLQRVLESITDDIFPNISTEELEYLEDNEERFHALLETLNEIDENGRYLNFIEELKKGFKKTKERIKKSPPATKTTTKKTTAKTP